MSKDKKKAPECPHCKDYGLMSYSTPTGPLWFCDNCDYGKDEVVAYAEESRWS